MEYWFLCKHCTYTEVYSPEHRYIFTGPCLNYWSRRMTVSVRGCDLYKFHRGAFIQDAFPYLSATEREWMLSGIVFFKTWFKSRKAKYCVRQRQD